MIPESRRTTLFAAGLLLVTFFTGILAGVALERGALSSRTFRREHEARHEGRPPDGPRRGPRGRDRIVERLTEELGLTAGQRADVESVLARQHDRVREIHRTVRPRVDSLTEQTHRELVEILTPEQRERLEELHDDRGFRNEFRRRRGH